MSNQRHFLRIYFNAPVTFVEKGKKWQTQLVDLSLKGALIERPRTWEGECGGSNSVTILLNKGETFITMETQTMHVENYHIGLRCHHIDLESMSHLKRLMELNLGNHDLLARDLCELVEQR